MIKALSIILNKIGIQQIEKYYLKTNYEKSFIKADARVLILSSVKTTTFALRKQCLYRKYYRSKFLYNIILLDPFNRSIMNYSIPIRSFNSLKDLIYNLDNFLVEYNHLRIHGRLGYIIPYEKLGKVTELLS